MPEYDKADQGDVRLALKGIQDALTAPPQEGDRSVLPLARRINVVFDLRGLELIDSSGVGAIVSTLQRVRTLQGDVKIARLTGQLTRSRLPPARSCLRDLPMMSTSQCGGSASSGYLGVPRPSDSFERWRAPRRCALRAQGCLCVGPRPGFHWSIFETSVSRRHRPHHACRGRYFVEDPGSGNGTFRERPRHHARYPA